MLETINCAVVLEDEKGFLLYVNQQMLDWTGYEAADLDHQPSSILLPLEMRDALEVERVRFQGGEHRTVLSALRRKNGRTFPVAVSPTPVTLADGSHGVISVCLDLGELQTARPFGVASGSMQEGLTEVASKLQTLVTASQISDESIPVPLDHPIFRELTRRERDVLSRLMAGSRVATIATEMFISPVTVRNHLQSIYKKTGVSSQAALIEMGRELGRS
jgi:PAS domain S-box-containing protein